MLTFSQTNNSNADHRNKGNIPLIIFALSLLTILSAILVLPPAMSRSAWIGTLIGVGIVCVIELGVVDKVRTFFVDNRKKAYLISVLVLVVSVVGCIGICMVFVALIALCIDSNSGIKSLYDFVRRIL